MIILMVFAVVLVAGLSVLAFTLAVYALPFMLGMEVARLAYVSGAGPIGAGLIGFISAAVAYGVLTVVFAELRSPILRLIVALVFAAPAALAGYALVHGITRDAMPTEVWRVIFCLIGGSVSGLSALMRLLATAQVDNQPMRTARQ